MTDKKFSTLVAESLPQFIREDYPMFVDFVEAYYEFTEQNKQPTDVLKNLLADQDIDTTSFGSKILKLEVGSGGYFIGEIVYQGASIGEAFAKGIVHAWDGDSQKLEVKNVIGQFNTGYGNITGVSSGASWGMVDLDAFNSSINDFITWFRKEFIPSIPQEIITDPRTLIKYARQFYKAKGTQKSYKLLFNILFGENVEFYYPWKDLLRPSDAKWVQNRTLRVIATKGNAFDFKDKTVTGESSKVTAFVEDVQVFQVGIYTVYELFLNTLSITGNFTPNELIVESTGEIIARISPVVTGIVLNDLGTGYTENDIITFTSASGLGAKAQIIAIDEDNNDSIRSIQMIDFGVEYDPFNPPSVVFPTSITSASATAIVGTITKYPGYFLDESGMLNASKYIQDGEYYQQFSYVLRANKSIETYRDVVLKLLHPAGLALFSSVLAINVLPIKVNATKGAYSGVVSSYVKINRQQFEDPLSFETLNQYQPDPLDLQISLPDGINTTERIFVNPEIKSINDLGANYRSIDMFHSTMKPMQNNKENLIPLSFSCKKAFSTSNVTFGSTQPKNPISGNFPYDRIFETTANAAHSITWRTYGMMNGQYYRGSIYARAVNGRNVRLQFSGAVASVSSLIVNLSTGALISKSGSGIVNYSIESVGNGWYRISAVLKTTADGNIDFIVTTINGSSPSFIGATNSGLDLCLPQMSHASMSQQYVMTPYTPKLSKRKNLFTSTYQNLSGAAWTRRGITVTANDIANPLNGAVDAYRIEETAANTYHDLYSDATNFYIVAGQAFRASVFVKQYGIHKAFSMQSTTVGINDSITVDLETGKYTTSGVPIQAGVKCLKNGWYEVWLVSLGTTTETINVTISLSNPIFSQYAGIAASGIYIYRPEFTRLLDKYSDNLENRLRYSEDLTNANHLSVQTSIVTNQIPNPLTAEITVDKLNETVSNVQHYFAFDPNNQYFLPGQRVCFSIFAKAAERNWLVVEAIGSAFTGSKLCNVNLSTGTFGTNTGSLPIHIEPYPDGWYRIFWYDTATAAGTAYIKLTIANANGGYVYAGTSGWGLYVANPQIGDSHASCLFTETVATGFISRVKGHVMNGGNADYWSKHANYQIKDFPQTYKEIREKANRFINIQPEPHVKILLNGAENSF